MTRLAGVLALVAAALPASAQTFSQRGLVEGTGIVYVQPTPVDDRQLIGEALFRQEVFWTPVSWLSLAGAFDARAATDDRVDPDWRFDCADRGLKRPAACVRRLSAALRRGGLTFEAGTQFVRWGKADILNPTDRFAPRDLLDVIDNDFLAVSAARLTYERRSNTIDLVWSPRFTPSRLPLADGRWGISTPGALTAALAAGGPLETPALPVVDLGAVYPSRPQAGVRWNHVASGFEVLAVGLRRVRPSAACRHRRESGSWANRGDARLPRHADGRGRHGLAAPPVHRQGRGGLLLDHRRPDGRLRELRHPAGTAERRVAAGRRLRGRVRDRTTHRQRRAARQLRARDDQELPRARALHDRRQPQPDVRGGRAPGRPRVLRQGRVFAAVQPALAGDGESRPARWRRRRLPRPVPGATRRYGSPFVTATEPGNAEPWGRGRNRR